MLFLLKIWIFNIDFGVIVSFIVGIVTGMIMLCLIYAIMVVVSFRDKKYAIKVQANDLKAKEAEDMIHIAQATFLDKDLRGDLSKAEHFKAIGTDLVYGIASRFYPDSKYPLFELSVDECVELIGYVQERLNEILDNRILRVFKKFKVSDIMKLKKATTAVVDSKAFELTKNVGKAFSIGKKILNAVNVFWWGKKFITDVGMDIIMKKLYLVVLGVIGEEAYKIYSKSYKNYAEDIDSNVNALVEAIDSDLQEAVKDTKPKEDKEEAKETLDIVPVEKEVKASPQMKKRVIVPQEGTSKHVSLFNRESKLKKKEKKEATALLALEAKEVQDEA